MPAPASLRSNVIANAAGLAGSGLLAVAVVPFQLGYLGVEAYGLIGFLASLQAVLALLDLGLMTTASREIARRAALGRPAEELRSLARTLQAVYVGMAILILAGLWIASAWIAGSWIQAERLPAETVRLAILVFAASVAVRWPVALYAGLLRGLERQVLLNGLSLSMSLLRLGGGVAILAFVSPTVEALLWWTLAAGGVELAVMGVTAWRALPAGGRSRFDSSMLRAIWRFTASLTAISALAAVLKQIDKMALSALRPLAELGPYNAATVASHALLLAPTAMFYAVVPRFSALVASGDVTRLADRYHQAARAVAFLSAPAAAAMMFFPREILLAWTRSPEVAEAGAAPLALLALGMLLNAPMQVPYSLQLAADLTRLPLWNNAVGALLLGPLTVFLVARQGLEGAAWSWVIFNVGYLLIIPPLMHRQVLRGHWGRWLLRDTLPFLALASAAFAAARWKLGASPWTAMLAAGSAYTLASLLLDGSLRTALRSMVERGSPAEAGKDPVVD